MEISYSSNLTISIETKELYLFCKPLVDEKQFFDCVKTELYHCWCGITSGDWGGNFVDWKRILFNELFKQGIIEQTEESISIYGKFKN